MPVLTPAMRPAAATPGSRNADWEAVLGDALARGAIQTVADLPPEEPEEPLPTPTQMRDLREIAAKNGCGVDTGMIRRLTQGGWVASRRFGQYTVPRIVLSDRGGEVLTRDAVAQNRLALTPLPLGTPLFVVVFDIWGATVAIEEATVAVRFPVEDSHGACHMVYVDKDWTGAVDLRETPEGQELTHIGVESKRALPRLRTCCDPESYAVVPHRLCAVFLTRAAAEGHLRDRLERLRTSAAASLGR